MQDTEGCCAVQPVLRRVCGYYSNPMDPRHYVLRGERRNDGAGPEGNGSPRHERDRNSRTCACCRSCCRGVTAGDLCPGLAPLGARTSAAAATLATVPRGLLRRLAPAPGGLLRRLAPAPGGLLRSGTDERCSFVPAADAVAQRKVRISPSAVPARSECVPGETEGSNESVSTVTVTGMVMT